MPDKLRDNYSHAKNMKTLSSALNALLKEIKNYSTVNEPEKILPSPRQITIGDIFSKHRLAKSILKAKQ